MNKVRYQNIEITQATPRTARNHQIDLRFTMNLDNVISEAVIENGILKNEDHIRRRVMDDVLKRFIPHVTQSPAMPDEIRSESTSSSKWRGSSNRNADKKNLLSLEHSTKVQLRISTDKPVDQMQALYAERGGFAAIIANEVLSHIHSVLRGSDESKSRTHTKISGNELTHVEHEYV